MPAVGWAPQAHARLAHYFLQAKPAPQKCSLFATLPRVSAPLQPSPLHHAKAYSHAEAYGHAKAYGHAEANGKPLLTARQMQACSVPDGKGWAALTA